jgi:hypothetical protein
MALIPTAAAAGAFESIEIKKILYQTETVFLRAFLFVVILGILYYAVTANQKPRNQGYPPQGYPPNYYPQQQLPYPPQPPPFQS